MTDGSGPTGATREHLWLPHQLGSIAVINDETGRGQAPKVAFGGAGLFSIAPVALNRVFLFL
jgi:hypothetical protein